MEHAERDGARFVATDDDDTRVLTDRVVTASRADED